METYEVPALATDPLPAVIAQPLTAWEAFTSGIRRALRYWPVLLLMLFVSLLAAGLLALIPALNLLGLAHQTVITDVASGVKAWQLIDLDRLIGGAAPAARSASLAGDARGSLSMLLVILIASPLVGGFVSAFAWGGVLLTYHEARESFSLKRCLWGCWHWFGANLVLAILQTLLFLGTCLPLAALLVFGRLGTALTVAVLALLVVVVLFWLMVFEIARVQLVVAGTRNPFRGLGRAFKRIFQRPLNLVAFYGLALLLLLAIQAFFRVGINPNVPLDAIVPALLAQQGFILARLFTRALRLAGLTAMG